MTIKIKPSPAGESGGKRPATVWLSQILLLICALIWLSALVLNLLLIAREEIEVSPVRLLGGVSILGSIVLVLLAAFWGLTRRRIYGRWLAVASLSVLWILVVYVQIWPPQGPVKRFEYNSRVQAVGAVTTSILISVIFLLLILRLAFAKSVTRFFRQDQSSS
jgi:hypothetical protein